MLHTILLGVIGGPELAVIIIALLILFGGKKIPELMRGLGQGIREFKEGQSGTSKEDEQAQSEERSTRHQ
ncbi:MAG TPA: twin-arginine translocase TatA/TatE family subunit [Pseudosphingobacterium sp.]|nr:twin-arginine translocase TatA/TatE family subunit [Pseudosphingobacterium sp.]